MLESLARSDFPKEENSQRNSLVSISCFSPQDPNILRIASGIIESGFEKTLIQGYGENFLAKPDAAIFLESKQRGAALVHSTNDGLYLDLMAVYGTFKGGGVGSALLDEVVAHSKNFESRLYWRTRLAREDSNRFYTSRFHLTPIPFTSVDGIEYNGFFLGYWRKIDDALSYMVKKPSNFRKE